MKIVFCGTPEWSVPALEALARSRHQVAGVVTAPDAPGRRSRRPLPPPVKSAALRLGLAPVLQPETLKGQAVRESILRLGADALVVVAFGRIIPGRLLDAPHWGAINLHFSLLPRHRGASPVQHTLLAGDALAGVTTMRMVRELDAGPVLLQRSTPVADDETSAGLGARLAMVGALLLVETLDLLESGAADEKRQDSSAVSWAPALSKRDGLVRWERPALEIERRVRAFDPWPPVVCRGPRSVLRIVRAKALTDVGPAAPGAPGLVLRRDGDAVDVVAGAGTILRVEQLQPAAGRSMTAAAALAGRHIEMGGRLLDGVAE